MTFAGRLVLGTFTIVALTLLVLVWGFEHGTLVGAAVVAMLLALGLAFVAGRSIASPLVTLSDAARAIAAGALPRFPRSGVPEVDALVQALREMNRQLADRFEELQLEKAEGEAIVDAMVEGIIAADARGRIVTANPAARRLLGYDADEPLPELRTLFRDKEAREAVTQVLAGEVVQNREVELDHQVISFNARPLPGSGAVLVLHDLTLVRQLEAIRRDFVANVSHELKTPLTSISGYAETLAEGGIDAVTARRFLETIRTNAQRMHRLVDDLLDLSRIESGHWVPRPATTSVAAVARDVFGATMDAAAERGVTLSLDLAKGADTLYADPESLNQILGNLIDNSLRYTPRGGVITCRTAQVPGGVELSVTDSGAGIPGEHLARIFERFYRAEPSRSRAEGGTGLGLAIVKHLIEAHGGRVSIESTLGAGTTVTARLPDASGDVTPS
ncbi:MAG: ATP-binding protein [Gemmatimonadota bacterium]